MSVLVNVYCIRPDGAPRHALRDIVARLERDGLVEGNVVQGPARGRVNGLAEPWIVSPDTAAFVYETESLPCRTFGSSSEAAAQLVEEDECGVAMAAAARGFRRDPTHFYSMPAGLGIYRVRDGHRLVVGAPEDFSDLEGDFPELAAEASAPPCFDGIVHEWIWLHGKNAPLEEDFLGSKLHLAIEALWPGMVVLADDWL